MAHHICGLPNASGLFVVILIFLALAEASGCRLSHMFIEKQDFRNMQSDLGFLTIFDMSSYTPVLCCRVCLRNNNCASYFENTRLKVCKLFSTVLTDLDITASESEGWQYFCKYVSWWCILRVCGIFLGAEIRSVSFLLLFLIKMSSEKKELTYQGVNSFPLKRELNI